MKHKFSFCKSQSVKTSLNNIFMWLSLKNCPWGILILEVYVIGSFKMIQLFNTVCSFPFKKVILRIQEKSLLEKLFSYQRLKTYLGIMKLSSEIVFGICILIYTFTCFVDFDRHGDYLLYSSVLNGDVQLELYF